MLSQLIGDIYDAVLAASPWTSALEKAARFVGGPAASLFSEDATSNSGALAYQYGIAPQYTRAYFEKYVKLAPVHVGRAFTEMEEPIAAADFIPYDKFLKSQFYREWAQPQGLVDFVVSVLDKSPTSVTVFGVFRHARDGVVDAETRRRMRVLTPHFRRAVLIGKVIDLGQTESAAFGAVFDSLSAAIFLVDASGGILHANAAGRAILAADDLLYSARGRLVARDAAADRALRAEFAAAAKGEVAAGTSGMGIQLISRDREHYVAHILPLAPGAGLQSNAVAALFVHRRALDAPTRPEMIARQYQLTPTELRVLMAIVNVGGGPRVADALGVTNGTVKTHLHRLYQKTGTARQADLVKLVASFATPLLLPVSAATSNEAALLAGRRPQIAPVRVAAGGGG